MNFILIDYHEQHRHWEMPRHSHPYFELIYIVHGDQKVGLDNQTMVAAAGEMLVYPPNVPHRETLGPSQRLAAYYIAFTSDWHPEHLHRNDTAGRVGILIEWLYSERDSTHDNLQNWNLSTLKLILEEYERLGYHAGTNIVETTRKFIRRNISQPLSLEQLAQNAGLSKYYFIREYQRLANRTPMADVRNIRLQQARSALLTSGAPLKEIALQVGLRNETHLSRLLKEHFGIGVRQMRNRKDS